MHELSIAKNIVDIVSEEAQKKNALKVTLVSLDVGELSGIENDALNFVWGSAVQNTLLDHSVLRINPVKGKAVCESCGHEYPMEDFFELCPVCQSFENRILEGKELKIKSIEIEY